jgi:hypothetical protein
MKPYEVTGEVLGFKGRQSVSFTLNGRVLERVRSMSLPTDAASLLGTDFGKINRND